MKVNKLACKGEKKTNKTTQINEDKNNKPHLTFMGQCIVIIF